jgi:uncharacterized membrane protein
MKILVPVLSVFGACFLALNLHAADAPKVDLSKLPPPAAKKDVTFAKDIKPILEKSCTRCHGADKPKGDLRLDSLETAIKGSEHGKVIQPGKSAESKLVIAVAQVGDPDDHMPPPNNRANIPPLTKDQVALIRAWIDQGAK